MEIKYTKREVLHSFFWKLMERGGVQGIQFVVQIILARLLAPEQFGIIAILMVFINLAQVFVQSGFNTALIQKKDADEDDFSSIFYLSLCIAGIIYIIIYISAPYIAMFYNNPILISILRVLSLTLFAGAFNSIQNAFVAKNFLFKKLFKSSLGAMLISGMAGVISAYNGLGVWSLVIQQLVNQFSITIIMWFTVKWRPRLVFSFKKVKQLFLFGSKLLASSLLNVLYRELRTLIIGRIYTTSMLGYYNRGEQFPKLIVTNIDGSIQSIMLPTLSAYQDDKKSVKQMMRRAIISSSFFIFPMMLGMAVIAEPLVKIVLTDKWLKCVPFLQVFCISYAIMPIHTANLQAINAMGRSDIFLKLEIIKKIIGLGILSITIPLGIYAIALGQIVSGLISSFINAYPNKRLLNYGYKEQIYDIFPSLFISILMAILIYTLRLLNLNVVILLCIQVLAGISTYFILSKIFKLNSLEYVLSTIRNIRQNS